MAVIDVAYETLKNYHLIKTKNDYSLRWLGMDISYYSTLKSKNRHASAKVYGRLAKKLMDQASVHRMSGEEPKAIEMSCLASACINQIIFANDNHGEVLSDKLHAHL